jgi:hypothetical protein
MFLLLAYSIHPFITNNFRAQSPGRPLSVSAQILLSFVSVASSPELFVSSTFRNSVLINCSLTRL